MKKFINSALTSILALAIGFGLMAFPFHIFDSLTGMQMRMLLAAEVLIYFGIFAAAAVIIEAKKDTKRKDAEHARKHNERIKKRRREMQGININDYNFAA